MGQKSATLYARIEPEVKKQAEDILYALGIPASNAITMFYKQIILHRGIPFDVSLPTTAPIDISTLTETELSEELEKGYRDMQEGNVMPANKVFSEFPKN